MGGQGEESLGRRYYGGLEKRGEEVEGEKEGGGEREKGMLGIRKK